MGRNSGKVGAEVEVVGTGTVEVVRERVVEVVGTGTVEVVRERVVEVVGTGTVEVAGIE